MTKNESSIQQCLRLIEASLQWGDAASWSNEDFEALSEKIYDATAVRLSTSTLKRIWGKVRYDSSPTTATLNALARYAGFENWRDFLNKTSPPSDEPSPSISPDQPELSPISTPLGGAKSPHTPRRRIRTGLLIVIIAAITGLLSLFAVRHKQRPSDASIAATRFESRQSSDGLPNSVVFQYDAENLHPTKLMIQQSWDTTRREEVAPDSKAHTSLYYYPGFFTARLIADGQTIRTSDVFIRTKGWKGIIQHAPIPIYLADNDIKTDKKLSITAATLQQKTNTTIFNDIWTEFDNVRDFSDMPGDSFSFSTTLRNTSTIEQCLCRGVRVYILGTTSAIIIPLADKGCISNINLLTGDQMILGKDHDLSFFGCDFRSQQKLECIVKDHRLDIRLNNSSVINVEQTRSIGKIIGIRVAFEGTGDISAISLASPTGNFDLIH